MKYYDEYSYKQIGEKLNIPEGTVASRLKRSLLKFKKILEESAFEHADISDRELTEARLVNFGNSSLDFQVLFFSKNIFRINKVKSDIRRIINQKFTENKIAIPFPQMDLHLKSNYTEISKMDKT